MFNRLKDRAKITDQDPKFKARYVGYTDTFTATGQGCTTPLVQKVWDNSEEERFLKRVQLKVTVAGIHMRNLDKKKEPEKLFPIENISFCNADTLVNEKLFSWICLDTDANMLKCHVVLCSSGEKAKAISLVMARVFQIAYKEWKSSQIKMRRQSEKYQRSQSLPTLKLHKKGDHRALTMRQSTGYSMNNGFEHAISENNVTESSEVYAKFNEPLEYDTNTSFQKEPGTNMPDTETSEVEANADENDGNRISREISVQAHM